ncbi:hypothetical protein BWP24_00715 [Vibrio campbellii]|nr:hypothetical protein BWP24_00715 [Vibrio campbellii]
MYLPLTSISTNDACYIRGEGFSFSILYSLFSILYSLFSILYSLFSILYSLFSNAAAFYVCLYGEKDSASKVSLNPVALILQSVLYCSVI